ncbi:MAG TPA: FxsA family protein [Lentisphaeria bacterium]|nr:FxsA family protein [Lentisphaeria bacterium]
MRLFTCLVLLFIGLPAIEILCLVTLGSAIGLLPTLILILGAGLLGAYLIRLEGLRALRQVQEALATGRNPSRQVLDGLAILVAGIALIFPGFFSDLVALFLLFGPTRRVAIALLLFIFPNLRPLAGGEQPHSGSDFPPAPKASEYIIDVTPQEVRDSTQQP